VVDSVDLTATPPLLSIGGETYTTDQIKRVIRPSTGDGGKDSGSGSDNGSGSDSGST
jgi:flagellar basal-body rod modification protein FlgD